tara:strand:+ start:1419 stop:1934 length:516 start_codon:yes stop_codon:yes gene_type:complete
MKSRNIIITGLLISNLLTLSYIVTGVPYVLDYTDDYVEDCSCTTVPDSDTVCIKRATVYNAVVEQCDSDPFTTADGSRINKRKLEAGKLRWIALSQDLVNDSYKARLHPGLFKGKFKFGDTLRVESSIHTSMNGLWVVRDVMNSRYRQSMDFLIPLRGKRLLGRDFKVYKN